MNKIFPRPFILEYICLQVLMQYSEHMLFGKFTNNNKKYWQNNKTEEEKNEILCYQIECAIIVYLSKIHCIYS